MTIFRAFMIPSFGDSVGEVLAGRRPGIDRGGVAAAWAWGRTLSRPGGGEVSVHGDDTVDALAEAHDDRDETRSGMCP